MKARSIEWIVTAAVCLALGLATGFYVRVSSDQPPAARGPTATADTIEFTPQSLRNLGVEIGRVQPTTFTRYRSVPAIVQKKPLTEQPLYAPFGGRVDRIFVEPGMLVTGGRKILTLVRDPIARPRLSLTEEILKPAQEAIHRTVIALRKSREEVRIFRTELDRVREFTGKIGADDFPILPRKTEIDLRYQLNRAEKDYEQARLELMKHGFSAAQIDDIVEGKPIPRHGEDTWKRALERNGLWPESAASLHAALPATVRSMPWIIATIGELSASGLLVPDLTQWLRGDEQAGRYLLEIGALLQKGHSIPDLVRLYELGAFRPVIEIVPPAGIDWDVHEILTKPGARVTAGTPLVTLLDPRMMYLRTLPAGGEKAHILRALEKRSTCTAAPLVPGTGPRLTGLKIAYVTSETAEGGTVAWVELENEPLAIVDEADGRTHRSWKLRSGLQYALEVPTERQDNVYVLPSSAVTEDGAAKVVFVQDGNSFKRVEVEVSHQDEEHAVVPIDRHTMLFPDDPVATKGAFALSLALRARTAPAADHHGHQH